MARFSCVWQATIRSDLNVLAKARCLRRVRGEATPLGAGLALCSSFAAQTRAAMRNARMGVMGHVYEGTFDMNSDPMMFDAYFGMHCEHIIEALARRWGIECANVTVPRHKRAQYAR